MSSRARARLVSASILLALAAAAPAHVRAGGAEGDELALASLASSKHSLADGIRAAAPTPAVAISAKFEDEGKGIVLSVYTATKGLGVGAEGNVLQELVGHPLATEWKPTTVVFGDVEHVARAAEQLTLMRLTKLTLADVAEKAQGIESGTVFSIAPSIRNGKGVFVVRIAVEGKAVEWTLDLLMGSRIERTPVKPIPKEPSRVGQLLSEPVVRGGRWISDAPPPLRELVAKKVVLVVSNSYLCEHTDEAWSWPKLEAWYQDERKNGFEIVFVMEDAVRVEDVEIYVRERKITYPVLHDPKRVNSKAWGSGAFLLDAEGKIAWNDRIGPQGDADGCEAAIRSQLKARAGTLSGAPR